MFIALRVWNIARWIWLTILIVFFVTLAANLSVVQVSDLSKTVLVNVLRWFSLFELVQILILSILGLFLASSLLSGIITAIDTYNKGGKVLYAYLRSIINANQSLNPTGIAQPSQALISVNVPLDDIFIHLRVLPDRPLYDIPRGLHQLQEEIMEVRRRSGLQSEELEDRIQRLRHTWYSQLEREWVEPKQKQNITIEGVLSRLTAKRSQVIILGAPGSGKSTTMRWLAHRMARACLSARYRLPKGLSPKQIPILLRISDYAKRLSKDEDLSFEQFFTQYFAKIDPLLLNRVFSELRKGHCLLLFDGLDEVASDILRRQVAKNIFEFISSHSMEKPTAKRFNRFIITSRIVGYEAGVFNSFAHYTLCELEDEQIRKFLNDWCPAVERYMIMAGQERKVLSREQEKLAEAEGTEQRERLLEALKNSPSVKRLAVNPLMLTILALIQRSGRSLPHRRVELYQVVTRTLLDNWNQETGRQVFKEEEIPLAEQLLANLAYRLHSSDPFIGEREVKIIVRETMADFYRCDISQISDDIIKPFIEKLRSSSGLFVESGQGLFSFMHRTFQEYYAASYLLYKSPEELKNFAREHYRFAIWREPLLLAITYKSGQSNKHERHEANELIQAILETNNSYDAVLHRNLLFAATCMIDCNAWSINSDLQSRIVNSLFDLYGDFFGTGRYKQLRQEVKKIALLLLRGQPSETSVYTAASPLLRVWQEALCNADHPVRQEGSLHLLVTIAPELSSCPKSVLSALTPYLLLLARLENIPCPSDILTGLSQGFSCRSSSMLEDYAFIGLHLLATDGPRTWLRDQWLQLRNERSVLLAQLDQHLLEIGHLIAPVTMLNRDPLIEKKKRQLDNSTGITADIYYNQTFQINDKLPYSYSYLLWKLLKEEAVNASKSVYWKQTWYRVLQKEVANGGAILYQLSLILMLLLSKGYEKHQKEIARKLLIFLPTTFKENTEVLTVIIDLYLQYLRNLNDENKRRSLFELSTSEDYEIISTLLEKREIVSAKFILKISDFRKIQRIENFFENSVSILCDALLSGKAVTLEVLITLFDLIGARKYIPIHIRRQVQESIQLFEQQDSSHYALYIEWVKAIINFCNPMPQTSEPRPRKINPSEYALQDELASALNTLRQVSRLTKAKVEEILKACTDTRSLSDDQQAKVGYKRTVQEVAWDLLNCQFNMDDEALLFVANALNHNEAIICMASALLLQSRETLPEEIKTIGAQNIMKVLLDEGLSRRPVKPPQTFLQLEEVLFETLRVLVE